VVLLCAALLPSCAREQPADSSLSIHWSTAPAAGAESVAELRLRANEAPVDRADLTVHAFMTHPGMAPVAAVVEEQGGGVYRARVRFTMAGDWVLRVQGTSADGRTIDLQGEVRDVRPAE
jgi:hypothetical protein